MDIRLKSFEKNVELRNSLIRLGKKYYDSGHVINLTQSSTNEWHANIKTIGEYSVNVELKDSKIVKSTCTCSFNGLHKIAAYYAIYNAEFPNKFSENSVSMITLSELEDDMIVQDACWAIHKEYLKLNEDLSKENISKTLSEIRKSLTKARNIAKKEKRPFPAVRLLSVSYDQLMEVKGHFVDSGVWDKLELRWYGLYELTKNSTDHVIEEIQNEKTAKDVTELLLKDVTDIILKEALELQYPEGSRYEYRVILEEYRDLYFKILIDISRLAQSYEQIEQLLNDPRLLRPEEKEDFMKKLLSKQGINI